VGGGKGVLGERGEGETCIDWFSEGERRKRTVRVRGHWGKEQKEKEGITHKHTHTPQKGKEKERREGELQTHFSKTGGLTSSRSKTSSRRKMNYLRRGSVSVRRDLG